MTFPRPLLSLVLVLVTAVAAPAVEPAQPAPLRVMSFNVRLSSAHDGINAWSHRRELLLDVVARFQPTLVGFQEVLADQHDEITRRFSDYAFVGVAREDGARKGEWALIGYRADRFTLLASGNFWLSEHPEQPGSKSWHTAYTRICTWVRLKDHVSGRELLYANTHLDNESKQARAESCRLLSTRLPQLAAGAPIVLTGDFNMNEDDPSFAPLTQPAVAGVRPLIDSYREVHPARSPDEASFHGFKGGTTGSRIDFIFHSRELIATEAAIDRTAGPAGVWPSDHYAVTAVLVIK
jgi:endonuclease/exonuclease/phosphatase family metal-dependent hydrolase